MASTAAAVTDYLIDVNTPWLSDLKRDILEPMAARALEHPALKQIESGEMPKEHIAHMLEDLCWVITGFPEYVAALAARCPKHDHIVKAALLENAYIEREHPFMLAQAVNGMGGDGDAILEGPDWRYEPSDYVLTLRMLLEAYVFHRPWVEGMAATAVGVESVVPAIFGRIGDACVKHYGLAEEDAEWFRVHGGEVEMEHGNEGLRVLDKYVGSDDIDTQKGCIAAIRIITNGISTGLFDTVASWQN